MCHHICAASTPQHKVPSTSEEVDVPVGVCLLDDLCGLWVDDWTSHGRVKHLKLKLSNSLADKTKMTAVLLVVVPLPNIVLMRFVNQLRGALPPPGGLESLRSHSRAVFCIAMFHLGIVA